MKKDPTRTRHLRDSFVADMNARLKRIVQAVLDAIVDKDVLGLLPPDKYLGLEKLTRNAVPLPKRFTFSSTSEKIKGFREWLELMIQSEMLSVVGGTKDKPWTSNYINSAYKAGVVRAWIDSHKGMKKLDPVLRETKQEFLQRSFNGPVSTERVMLLYTRNFEQLKGISADMSSRMSVQLATGLSNGYGPRKIASDLANTVSTIGRRRALVLARTEIIHAYAEGQLDTFEDLGVEELGVDVEFSNTGDDRVCPICIALGGKIYTVETARGVIPVHPQCRCAWIPYVETKKKQQGRKTKKKGGR